jgi:hypothetical protein
MTVPLGSLTSADRVDDFLIKNSDRIEAPSTHLYSYAQTYYSRAMGPLCVWRW